MTRGSPKKTRVERMLEGMRALQKGELDGFGGLRIDRRAPKELTLEEEREAREILRMLGEPPERLLGTPPKKHTQEERRRSK